MPSSFRTVLTVFSLAVSMTLVVHAEPAATWVLYDDPQLAIDEPQYVFPAELKPLWVAALQRPDGAVQRMAADTMAVAAGRGMQGLGDTAPRLREIVESSEEPSLRRAAVAALVAIDARDSIEVLREQVGSSDVDLARAVETTLAQWDAPYIQDIWRKRLAESDAPRSLLMLALAGVDRGDDETTPLLLKHVSDRAQPTAVRLSAARAAARLVDTGLVPQAQQRLDGDATAIDRLLAATLLSRHADADAIVVLQNLANAEPVVAVVALQRLLEVAPDLVADRAARDVDSRDPAIRRVALESLRGRREVTSVASLGVLLNDAIPEIRQSASSALLDFAADESLRAAVVDRALAATQEDGWRAVEQGLLILGKLEHQSAAANCVDALSHRRPEVVAAAAWSLGTMRADAAMSDLFQRAVAWHQSREAEKLTVHQALAVDLQLGQAFQAFGRVGYFPAEPLLRLYVPRDMGKGKAREAAIWALGHFYAGAAPRDLAAELQERLADTETTPPEDFAVRKMCAISLGRMGAREQLPSLRHFLEEDGSNSYVGQACSWSISRMTGEPRVPPEPPVIRAIDWFLRPL